MKRDTNYMKNITITWKKDNQKLKKRKRNKTTSETAPISPKPPIYGEDLLKKKKQLEQLTWGSFHLHSAGWKVLRLASV